ncbi:hypothetical protein QZH41_019730 [Actinostola sp. cb2023]|nr:hypothetical protein QZH41_019730 [Actinostola sp. cb2023]
MIPYRSRFYAEKNWVLRGYVDNERNTDNAWMETMITNFHDDTGEIFGNVQFAAKDDVCSMAWLVVSRQLNLPENHVTFLKKVSRLHNAYF